MVATRVGGVKRQEVGVDTRERSLHGILSTQHLLEDVVTEGLREGTITDEEADSIQKMASYRNASAKEIKFRRFTTLMHKYGQNKADWGRTEVQGE